MGAVAGFLEVDRIEPADRPVAERVRDFREVTLRLPVVEARAQASRCMDCGVPFCHSRALEGTELAGGGCPLGNVIPEFNDLVYRGRWEEAARTLERTNNFPEITGRVCPAPCEAACVLEPTGAPVTIEAIERAIADEDFERHRRFVPRPAARRTHRRVAVVGSGPAGLAAAQELARAGHDVEVFEKADRVGGLLRYGIPDFKLDKVWIDRRVAQMQAEGVRFRVGVDIGRDEPLEALAARFDAVILALGASRPRRLDVPGSALAGVHLAMDYLEAQNRAVSEGRRASINVSGKRVVVIGGGDTGSDCIGTAVRQGAASVVNVELLPEPPRARTVEMPWPAWPAVLRTSSSHEEAVHVFGADVRRFALETVRLLGDDDGRLRALVARPVRLERRADGSRAFVPVEDATEETIPCDVVLVAMGFSGVEARGLEIALAPRGTITTDGFATSIPKVWACGDARRGPSLVVWAIAEGRDCARAVDVALAESSSRAS